MVTEIVVDASIIAKFAIVETDSASVSARFGELVRHNRLLAPSLLRYEVGNAVAKQRKDFQESLVQKALAGVETRDPTDVAAHAKSLSYYDAAYIALAVEQKAALWTADAKMAKAARKAGVPVVA